MILGAVRRQELSTEGNGWIILTHIHLDHAGVAGRLLQECKRAQVLVHPRGAPHMLGPSRLWKGVRALYGEQATKEKYGKPIPIPKARLVTLHGYCGCSCCAICSAAGRNSVRYNCTQSLNGRLLVSACTVMTVGGRGAGAARRA